MGSAAAASYEKLRKRLLDLAEVRERPEKPGSPFALVTARPTLWLRGKRFVSFHLDDARRLHAAVRVPAGFAADVPESARAEDSGEHEAWFDLARRAEVARAEEVARFVHARMLNAPSP